MSSFFKHILLLSIVLFISSSCQKEYSNTSINHSSINQKLWYIDSISYETDLINSEKDNYILNGIKILSEIDVNSQTYRKYSLNLAYNAFLTKNDSLFNILIDYAKESSKNSLDTMNLAKTYRFLGYYFDSKDQLQVGYKNYYKSNSLYESISNSKNVALTHRLMGENQIDLFQYNGAENDLFKAVKIAKEINDTEILRSSYESIVILFSELGEFEEAKEYNYKWHELIDKNDSVSLTSNFNSLGNISSKEKRFNEALEMISTAIKYNGNNRDSFYYRLKDNYNNCKLELNQLSGLERSFVENYHEKLKLNDTAGVVSNRISISKLYIKKDNYNLALSSANEAIYLSNKANLSYLELKSLKWLIKIDTTNVKPHSLKYIALRDSLKENTRKVRNNLARIRMETDEYKEQYEKITNINYWLYAVVFLLTTLVVLVLYFKNQKIKYVKIISDRKKRDAIEEVLKDEKRKLNGIKRQIASNISKELHDNILSQLFAIRLNLDSLNNSDNEEDIASRQIYIDAIVDIENSLREVSHKLKQTMDSNLLKAIESLLENTMLSKNIKYNISNSFTNWEGIGNEEKITLYRIFQEIFTNIVKHSKASNVDIVFTGDNSNLNCLIVDDGIGFKANKIKRGIGLDNIIERLSEINSTLKIDTEPNNGTSISFSINIEEDENR